MRATSTIEYMKTIKQVPVTPVFVDQIPEKSLMEEGKLYISMMYHTAIHLCLCGCGNQTVTPFEPALNGWTLTNVDGLITLSPSIGNYSFPCKSHYIITKNKANFV